MESTKSYRVGVVALLFAGTFINAVDRASLSVAAPLIIKEFQLDTASMGIALSAFFLALCYAQRSDRRAFRSPADKECAGVGRRPLVVGLGRHRIGPESAATDRVPAYGRGGRVCIISCKHENHC